MIYRVENKMTLFTNAELGNVRVLEIDGEPYFVGKDVAVALGYVKPENAISAHVDQEDKTTTLIQGDGSNYKSKTTLINESGLYSLILSSKLPSAKAFKRWITAEVLPVVRKTGGYVNDTKQFVDYYFADCNTYGREAITLMLNETKRMANQLKAQAPKVLFAEAVESSKTSIPVGDLAKLIKSKAEAEANDTLEKSLTDKILKEKYIEKWDGKLPSVMTGDDGSSIMIQK